MHYYLIDRKHTEEVSAWFWFNARESSWFRQDVTHCKSGMYSKPYMAVWMQSEDDSLEVMFKLANVDIIRATLDEKPE